MENNADIDNHCLEKVKNEDNDRYQVIILTPEVYHRCLFAVAAYNIELAHCLENITEPMLSQIKLQWWVEALEDAKSGTVREHPVLQAMQSAGLLSRDDSYAILKSLCEYRLDHVVLGQNQSLNATNEYARCTSGALHRLFITLLDIREEDLLRAAEEIGTAFGLLGFLKAMCFQNYDQIDLIPMDTMQSEQLSRSDLMQQDLTPIIIKACHDITSEIYGSLKSARQTSIKGQKNTAGLFQLTVRIEYDLNLMLKHNFKAKKINLEQGAFKLLCKSLWNMLTNRF